jgi:hypothetical protein
MKLTINKTEEIELTEREGEIWEHGRKRPDVFTAIHLIGLGICIGMIIMAIIWHQTQGVWR